MEEKSKNLLVNQLIFSKKKHGYSSREWELLLRQARVSGVLSRLFFFWKNFSLFVVPNYVADHLVSANKFWLSQNRIVNWELYLLQAIFHKLQLPLILLKGSAYSAAHLNAGMGRVFNDIDILVPKEKLQAVVEALTFHGWFPQIENDYDKNYYEHWMHELPPMRHIKRSTSLDVHHNILPQTCRLCPNAAFLLKAAVLVPDSNFWILAPEDMILHSASHLFWGGEFENGLRDLSDLDLLLREFSQNDPDFWQGLLNRSRVLGLHQPLFYALRYAAKMLQTPVSENILEQSNFHGSWKIKTLLMDFLFLRALLPDHPACDDQWTGFARWLLYIRSHWLKMPWYLLLPHLSRKAWLRLTGKDKH